MINSLNKAGYFLRGGDLGGYPKIPITVWSPAMKIYPLSHTFGPPKTNSDSEHSKKECACSGILLIQGGLMKSTSRKIRVSRRMITRD